MLSILFVFLGFLINYQPHSQGSSFPFPGAGEGEPGKKLERPCEQGRVSCMFFSMSILVNMSFEFKGVSGLNPFVNIM